MQKKKKAPICGSVAQLFSLQQFRAWCSILMRTKPGIGQTQLLNRYATRIYLTVDDWDCHLTHREVSHGCWHVHCSISHIRIQPTCMQSKIKFLFLSYATAGKTFPHIKDPIDVASMVSFLFDIIRKIESHSSIRPVNPTIQSLSSKLLSHWNIKLKLIYRLCTRFAYQT